MFRFALVVFVICLASHAFSLSVQNPIVINEGQMQYLYYSGTFKADHDSAIAQCKAIGSSLADISSQKVLKAIGKKLKANDFAFINAWKGDNYNGACITLVKNTDPQLDKYAVVVPVNGCSGPYSFICQRPKAP